MSLMVKVVETAQEYFDNFMVSLPTWIRKTLAVQRIALALALTDYGI